MSSLHKPRKAATTVAALAVFCSLLPMTAFGARFPNAVKKTFAVTGHAATSVATLLGMSTSGSSSVSLPLDKGVAWAVYLLKQDTKTPLYNGDGPPRSNRVAFSSSPVPTLTLAPYWLDLATALPNSRPGYYSFSSPFIAQDLKSNDSWTQMLKRLKSEPGWDSKGFPQFQRCFTSADKTGICIAIYGNKDYINNVERDGYMETITIHSKLNYESRGNRRVPLSCKIATIAVALAGLGIAAAVADPAPPAPAATGAPAPAVTIGPDWARAAPQNGAAVRFERTTASGVESLSGARQVCDCPAAQAAATLEGVFKQMPSVTVTVTETTMCNEPATNLLLTGYAPPHSTGNNLDVYFFRLSDSLYTLTYAFLSDLPDPDAMATLPALCPHSPK